MASLPFCFSLSTSEAGEHGEGKWIPDSPIQPCGFEEYKQNAVFSTYLISKWHFGTSLEHLDTVNTAGREVARCELQCTYGTAVAKFPCFASWKCNQLWILDFSHTGNCELLPQTSWLEGFQWSCAFSCLGYFHIKRSHSQSTVRADGDVWAPRAFVISHGTNYRYPLLYGIQMGYPGTLLLPWSLHKKDLFP